LPFFIGLKKLFLRKKDKGYYNSDYIISTREKQSLIIGFSIIIIPLLIALALISLNY